MGAKPIYKTGSSPRLAFNGIDIVSIPSASRDRLLDQKLPIAQSYKVDHILSPKASKDSLIDICRTQSIMNEAASQDSDVDILQRVQSFHEAAVAETINKIANLKSSNSALPTSAIKSQSPPPVMPSAPASTLPSEQPSSYQLSPKTPAEATLLPYKPQNLNYNSVINIQKNLANALKANTKSGKKKEKTAGQPGYQTKYFGTSGQGHSKPVGKDNSQKPASRNSCGTTETSSQSRHALTAALEMYKSLANAAFSDKGIAGWASKQSIIDFQECHINQALENMFTTHKDNLSSASQAQNCAKSLTEKPFLHQYHFHSSRVKSAKGSKPMGVGLLSSTGQKHALEVVKDSGVSLASAASARIQPWHGTSTALSLPESAPEIDANKRQRFCLGRSNRADFLWKVAIGAELALVATDHKKNKSRQLHFYKKILTNRIDANSAELSLDQKYTEPVHVPLSQVKIVVQDKKTSNRKPKPHETLLVNATMTVAANATIKKAIKDNERQLERARELNSNKAADNDLNGQVTNTLLKPFKEKSHYSGAVMKPVSKHAVRNSFVNQCQFNVVQLEHKGDEIAQARISDFEPNAIKATYPQSFKDILA